MSSFADDFRAEALQKRGDVVGRKLRGWSFCLSYGAVAPARALELMKMAKLRAVFREKDVTELVERKLADAMETDWDDPKEEWMFSAKLYPPDRSSTEEDWRFLGEMAAALRIPPNAVHSPIAETPPDGTFYWIWSEKT
jgi:hypothetical protein